MLADLSTAFHSPADWPAHRALPPARAQDRKPDRIAAVLRLPVEGPAPACQKGLGAGAISKNPVKGKRMAETKMTERPISPHLQIYRWPLPMAMSIVHRVTGGALYFGTILLAWWLTAAGSGPNAYSKITSFVDSFFGRLILFGYTWALMLHMLGGIRHLIWDTGRGFSKPDRDGLALATIVGSVILTVLLWIVGLLFMGGSR
jgi:succinate dehydrogenase / fumarate reductase, cytochrome b subunit